MARFRFTKKKDTKDDPNSTNTSTTSPRRSSKRFTNILHSQTSPQHSPKLPIKDQQDSIDHKHLSQQQHLQQQQQQEKILEKESPEMPHQPVLSSPSQTNHQFLSPTPLGVVPKVWSRYKLFDSPFPRYRHACASIATHEKSEIFLMGGLKDGSVFGDTWKIVPQIDHHGEIINYVAENIEVFNHINPPARVGHGAVLCGNAFIIYGGDTVDTDPNGFPDNDFYLFNINNFKYTIPSHIQNKPNGRYGHSIGVVSSSNSSKLFLFGGQLENDVFNDLYYFELNSFKSTRAAWTQVEPLNNFKPPPLTNHSMCIYNQKIYIFGGVYNNEKVSNDLWEFDVTANKWSQITTTGELPLPVNEHACCVVDNKMYIHGGNDFSGIIYSALYVLDLDTLEWTKLPDQGEENGPGPRCGHSMTWLPKFNKIVIMGGDKNDYVDSDPHNFDTFEELVGSEIGTMIYELDVPVFDRYVTSLHAPVIIPQPITTKPHPQVPQQQDKVPVELPREQNHDEEDEEEEEVGGYSRAKRVAASAVVPNPRHGRSVSAGPEEFETPQGSIRGESPDRRNEDNFVEVDLPSTNLSQLDYDSVAGENSNGRSNGSEEPGRRRSLDPRQDLPPSDSKVNESREVNPTIGAAGVIGAAAAVGAAAAATASSNNNNHNKGLVADDSFTEREANSTVVSVPKSGEHDGKVKKIISELTNELVQLKASTKEQMQRATDKIEQLERQNSLLQQSQQRDVDHYTKQLNDKDVLINELKSSLDPSAWDPEQPQGETNISEVNRYKLERLELNNKLVYLEQENTKLKEKFEEFEPFMDNQIGELDKFQKVIKVQEQQIEKLSSQVKDQEGLHKEINDWKSKHENLALEFENYRAIHNDDEISDSEAELHNNNSHDDRSVLSSARSRRDISSHLENLVQLWNHKNSREPSVPVDTNNAVVAKLQAQVDDLLKVGKQNEQTYTQEIEALKKDLEEKTLSLKNVEDNYRESIQSVNNTSKALKLNQDELNNQRTLMERLSKENNELKMLKKALGSRDGTPVVNEYKNIQDEEVISTAHYNMKIKDLEADLYILKQERDQLKDNVTSLQKQLYLAQNN